MMEKILLVTLLVLGISSIGIPIRMRETKCMIVYSVGESETVKIEAQLPMIPGKVDNEYYEITILNTETNQLTSENYNNGNYKRQLTLVPNIIYEICFKVRSDRQFGKVIIQYTAENLFNIDHSEVKVPENLLKSGDFKISYQNAQKLKVVTQKFKQLQTARKESQSTTFIQTTGLNQWLIYISAGQIVIIIVTAIYQFFSLHSFLSKKQLV